MKKNSLTTAVVAGLAGVAGFAGLANAVDLNPDGLGQVLIYPYYTVNKGQDTMLSVVNTADIGKAVKVRFLEGYNSREVLDFNLFLSPHDVWTATIVAKGDDSSGGKLITHDRSCVYPDTAGGENIRTTGFSFRTAAFDGGYAPFPKDGGPTDVTRTREGYFEIISMGDIVPGSDLYDETLHAQGNGPNGGVPSCDKSVIGNNAGGYLVAPTGGLFGSVGIVNVAEGTYFAYNADAIDGFTDTVLFSGSAQLTPSLAQANHLPAGGAAAGTRATAYVFQGGGSLVQLDYANGIDAVSAVLTADHIYNEYTVSSNIGSNTDWVVTFPTKRFYVDKYYVGATAVAPFVEVFNKESNVEIGINVYDQEEGHGTVDDDISPPISSKPNALPFEVNVISWLTDTTAGAPSAVLGSKLRPNIPPYADGGWAALDLASGDAGHALRQDLNGKVLHGLPVTGFMGYSLVNGNISGGVLANYGGLFRHRASRLCTQGDVACS